MKNTFKVVMLPTEKASRIQLIGKYISLFDNAQHANSGYVSQYLYVLSDDEIKEGDWVINLETKQISDTLKYDFHKVVTERFSSIHKKIVATTDKSLNGKSDSGLQMCLYGTWQMGKDGYPTCKGNCHTLDMPESFIQAYIKAYNEGKPITEVDLEMDMNDTDKMLVDEGYVKNNSVFGIKTRPDNTVIIHQSKMYSKDEVIKLIEKYHEAWVDRPIYDDDEDPPITSKWIQDNL